VEFLSRNRLNTKRDILGIAEPGKVTFVGLQEQPNFGKVCDLEELITGFDIGSQIDRFSDDDAILGRTDGDAVAGILLGGNLINLFF
jgi:hypothetical protein